MTIHIYLRVSTEHQSRSGLGILAQQEQCIHFAKTTYGDDVEMVIYKDEGISGTTDHWKRPALVSIMEVIKSGDVLLSYDGSRIARDTFVWLTIEREIQKKGSKIEFAQGTNGDGLEVQLVRRILAQVSEFAVRKGAERTSAALQAKIRDGYIMGKARYGWKISDCRREKVEVKEEQEVLSLVRNLREHGASWVKVVAKLNNGGYTTRAGRNWTYQNAYMVFNKRS